MTVYLDIACSTVANVGLQKLICSIEFAGLASASSDWHNGQVNVNFKLDEIGISKWAANFSQSPYDKVQVKAIFLFVYFL